MSDDMRIRGVFFEEDSSGDVARLYEARLRELEQALATAERQRDYHRLLGKSWQDESRRDLEAKLAAEAERREADELLGRTRDLLVGWVASHEDPGLRRRTELFLEDIERHFAGPGSW